MMNIGSVNTTTNTTKMMHNAVRSFKLNVEKFQKVMSTKIYDKLMNIRGLTGTFKSNSWNITGNNTPDSNTALNIGPMGEGNGTIFPTESQSKVMGKSFTAAMLFARAAEDIFGRIMQKLGTWSGWKQTQPLFDAMDAIVQSGAMQTLAPAMERFAKYLSEPTTQQNLIEFGKVLGVFAGMGLDVIIAFGKAFEAIDKFFHDMAAWWNTTFGAPAASKGGTTTNLTIEMKQDLVTNMVAGANAGAQDTLNFVYGIWAQLGD